jgi:hypothetical protein
MVVVNPYLKKKKTAPPPPPTGGGTVDATKRLSSLPSSSQHVTPAKGSTANTSKSKGDSYNNNNSSLMKIGAVPLVTPGKSVNLPSTIKNPSAVKNTSKQPSTRLVSAGVSNRPLSIPRSASTVPTAHHNMTSSSAKGLSLKQQLKQEIAMLKKQKQLNKLQKEAEDRRRKLLAEKAEKERQRLAMLAAREEERKKKDAERERMVALRLQEQQQRQKEREMEQQRKREEKRLREEERERKEQELREQERRRAELKYQRELEIWKYQHQMWREQEHRRLQAHQQQYGNTRWHYGMQVPYQTTNYFPTVIPGHSSYGHLHNSAQSLSISTNENTPTSQPSTSNNESNPSSLNSAQSQDETPDQISSKASIDTIQAALDQIPSHQSNNASENLLNDETNLLKVESMNSSMEADKNDQSSKHIIPTADTSMSNPALLYPSMTQQNNPQRLEQQHHHHQPTAMAWNNPHITSMPNQCIPGNCGGPILLPYQQGQSIASHHYNQWNMMQVPPFISGFAESPYSLFVPTPPPPPPRPPILFWRGQHRQMVNTSRPKSAIQKPPLPSRLCEPLKAPSPFARQGRQILTVVLVRNPENETSFGVNVTCQKFSALVDPDWLDAQEMQQKKKREPMLNESVVVDDAKSDATQSDDKMKAEQKPSMNTIENNVTVDEHVTNETCDKPTTIKSEHMKTDYIDTKVAAKENKVMTTALVPSKQDSLQSEKDTKLMCQQTDVVESEAANTVSVVATQSDSNDISSKDEKQICNGNNDETPTKAVEESKEESGTENFLDGVMSRSTLPDQPQKKKRRRRANFAVMIVSDSTAQNARRPDLASNDKLQSGDIIISIGGEDLSGLLFSDACKIFSEKAEKVNESLIQVQVIIARKNAPVAVVKPSNPVISKAISTEINPSSALHTPFPEPHDNTSMNFSPSEIAVLVNQIWLALHHSKRILGQNISDAIWQETSLIFRMGASGKETPLSYRSMGPLRDKWLQLTRLVDYKLADKARSFWAQKLEEECGTLDLPFSSDAERCAMRYLPRPSKGCRCRQQDHQYLFDPKCVLYRDIRRRLSTDELDELLRQKSKSNVVGPKNLNAVESAYKNRILKLKATTENEKLEARFVDKMEEIQVKELKKAIFAPNLPSMVLSTIFELQREFPMTHEGNQSDDEDEDMEDEEDDDDDDVPLIELGKRKSEAQGTNKKLQRLSDRDDPKINMQYLMRMLEYVSKTWGHCYREPSREDNAWRWEVFHGSFSSQEQIEAHSTSPRVPNSLPFENIQFGLPTSKQILDDLSTSRERIRGFEDNILSQSNSLEVNIDNANNSGNEAEKKYLHKPEEAGAKKCPDQNLKSVDAPLDMSNETLDLLCLAVHLLSPSGTGLYDEILALFKMEILKVRDGIPILTRDWYTKVDIMILDDLGNAWSLEADPDGKFGINEEFRDTLEEQWIKYDYGWALADDPKEIVFEYSVLDEWREAFEDRLEEKKNISEGIGRFGL